MYGKSGEAGLPQVQLPNNKNLTCLMVFYRSFEKKYAQVDIWIKSPQGEIDFFHQKMCQKPPAIVTPPWR